MRESERKLPRVVWLCFAMRAKRLHCSQHSWWDDSITLLLFEASLTGHRTQKNTKNLLYYWLIRFNRGETSNEKKKSTQYMHVKLTCPIILASLPNELAPWHICALHRWIMRNRARNCCASTQTVWLVAAGGSGKFLYHCVDARWANLKWRSESYGFSYGSGHKLYWWYLNTSMTKWPSSITTVFVFDGGHLILRCQIYHPKHYQYNLNTITHDKTDGKCVYQYSVCLCKMETPIDGYRVLCAGIYACAWRGSI